MLEDFKSRINPSKEPTGWTCPFEISREFMYGTIEIMHPERGKMRIGAERLKMFHPVGPQGHSKVTDLGHTG
ncbi:hypothetical protein LINGRAHAP2_LOCUS23101 [Linum grandiflorum]